jgi:hypothetical protein
MTGLNVRVFSGEPPDVCYELVVVYAMGDDPVDLGRELEVIGDVDDVVDEMSVDWDWVGSKVRDSDCDEVSRKEHVESG